MPRWARVLFVVLGPPILASWPLLQETLVPAKQPSRLPAIEVSLLVAHLAAAMLVLAALVMAVRLRWAPGATTLGIATFLAWGDVAAAWGVLWCRGMADSAAGAGLRGAIASGSAALSVTGLLSAGFLAWMVRRARRPGRASKPWTLFA